MMETVPAISPPGIPTNIPTTTRLTGTLDHIRCKRDGWILGKLRAPGRAALVSVKGTCVSPQIGATYHLDGRWTSHPLYGESFAFDSYAVELPTTREAVATYLQATAMWIGPMIAGAICDAFTPEAALHVLKTDPARVAATIRGITPERAASIQRTLLDNERLELVTVQLHALVLAAGLGKATVKKALERWGHQAQDVVAADPFVLTQLHGIGFLSADRVRAHLGVSPESPSRIRAGVLHVLSESCEREGHTFISEAAFRAAAIEALTLPASVIEGQLQALAEAHDVVVECVDGPAEELPPMGYQIALYSTRQAELSVASKIASMVAYGACGELEEVDTAGLADDQAEALRRLLRSRVFILTGAPGTGKTHLCRRILEVFRGQRIALAAPTGKAAQRVSELTGVRAQTIHRLLEATPGGSSSSSSDGASGFTFARNADNPLAASIIIVDETSMVDIHLMASLCEAVPRTARLILIGDTNQLPSVGPGNVLRDLIASGLVETAELRTIKRQDAGMIIQACHAIRDGRAVAIDNERSADFFWQPEATEEAIANAIVELVCTRLPGYSPGFDPIRDIQVIAPLRERGQISCKALNLRLQAHLNPNAASLSESDAAGPGRAARQKFAVGDKVVQTRNDYEHGVFNGEIGIVTALGGADQTITVVFEVPAPARTMTVKLSDADLELAYAITVHRAQGSEWPVVVMPIHRSQTPLLLQRNLLYTAISRAQRIFVGVGQQGEIPKIVRRQHQARRLTKLEQFLRDFGGGTPEEAAP